MLQRLWAAFWSSPMLILTLAPVFWGGNVVVGRAAAGLVPPVALGGLRWLLAALVLLPFAWPHLKRDWPLMRASVPILVALGITGIGAYGTALYIGLTGTEALNALVINASAPILIAIFCVLFLGDRIGPVQIAGIAVSLLGVLLVVARGNPAALGVLKSGAGDLWIIAANILWAVYTGFLRKKPKIHPLSFACASFAIGGLVNVPFMMGEHVSGVVLQPTLATLLAVGYVTLFPSIGSYILFNRGVELIGGPRAGAFMHLVPFFGAIMSIIFLGERLQWFHLAGFALILTGVWLASRAAAPKQA